MRSEIMKLIFALGEYYDKKLTPEQLEMYSQDLSSLSPDELRQAIMKYRGDGKNERFPLPAKLIEMVRPKSNELDEGRDVASRVIAAVGKFGSYNSEGARAYAGEVGWEIVQRFGGWRALCQDLTSENQNMMFAQMRDLAMTLVKRSREGTIATPVEFPGMLPSGATRSGDLKSLGDIARSIVDQSKKP